MNYDVIVTCAVTGAGDTRDKNPHVPVTPQEIAKFAIAAAKAGAAVAHAMSATQTQPKGHAMSIYSAKPSI